jgi:hypothetical protein
MVHCIIPPPGKSVIPAISVILLPPDQSPIMTIVVETNDNPEQNVVIKYVTEKVRKAVDELYATLFENIRRRHVEYEPFPNIEQLLSKELSFCVFHVSAGKEIGEPGIKAELSPVNSLEEDIGYWALSDVAPSITVLGRISIKDINSSLVREEIFHLIHKANLGEPEGLESELAPLILQVFSAITDAAGRTYETETA